MKHLQMLWNAALTLAILTDPSLGDNTFCSTPNAEPFYALVVDGGSTSSRMRVYRWESNDREGPVIEVIPNATIKDNFNFKVKPALSSFATGNDAGESLGDLVEAAKELVPEGAWPRTPLYVLCTGGVRLLEPESAQLAVLDDVHAYLLKPTNSPFSLQKVTVLSGENEGLGLYVTVNEGTGSPPEEWKGVLDMGGSSLQYVFSPKILLGNSQSLLVNGVVVQVFSDSYGGFGKDKMRDLYLNDIVESGTVDGSGNYPAECFAPNYLESFTTKSGTEVNIMGTGNGIACEEEIDGLLELDESCNLPPCGLMGKYVPAVNKDIGYVAISSFYYAARDLDLLVDSDESTADALYDAAISNCGKDLTETAEDYDKNRCFDALYCARVLSAIGLEDQVITFSNELADGGSLDFTRGALVMDRAAVLLSCEPEACEQPSTSPSTSPSKSPSKQLSRSPTSSAPRIQITIPASLSITGFGNPQTADEVATIVSIVGPTIAATVAKNLRTGQKVTEVIVISVNGIKVGAGTAFRRHLTSRMLPVGQIDIAYEVLLEEICASITCDDAQEVANALYDSATESMQKEIDDGKFTTALEVMAEEVGESLQLAVESAEFSAVVLKVLSLASIWYPSWTGGKHCLNDGAQPFFMKSNSRDWLSNTRDGCCTRYYSWDYSACMGDDNEGVIGYYPAWDGTEKCVNDTKAPDYMGLNPSQWMFDDVDSCCQRYYNWNLADCVSKSGGDTTSAATLKWYVNHMDQICEQDCPEKPGEPCGGLVPSWKDLYETPASCCENALPWITVAICAARSQLTPYPGTSKWYLDGKLQRCVQDCVGAAPCGGLLESWEDAFDSSNECCSTELWWLERKSCIST